MLPLKHTLYGAMAELTEIIRYHKNVQRMWELNSTRIITNGSAEHASVLIESFLANAQRKIEIFCHDLSAKVYDKESFIRKTKQALQRGVEIEIVSQNKPSHKSEFMNTYSDLIKEFPISLKFCKNGSTAESEKMNFAVCDSNAYRAEEDYNKTEAIACLNDPATSQALSNYFKRLSCSAFN